MVGYKVYSVCEIGFEDNISYFTNKDKAIQVFNNLIRKFIKELEIIDRNDFSEEIQGCREANKDLTMVSRTYPVIVYEKQNSTLAFIQHWEEVWWETGEKDIVCDRVIIDEINIID